MFNILRLLVVTFSQAEFQLDIRVENNLMPVKEVRVHFIYLGEVNIGQESDLFVSLSGFSSTISHIEGGFAALFHYCF